MRNTWTGTESAMHQTRASRDSRPRAIPPPTMTGIGGATCRITIATTVSPVPNFTVTDYESNRRRE